MDFGFDSFTIAVLIAIGINEIIGIKVKSSIMKGRVEKERSIKILVALEAVVWLIVIFSESLISRYYFGEESWLKGWWVVAIVAVCVTISAFRFQEVLTEIDVNEIERS